MYIFPCVSLVWVKVTLIRGEVESWQRKGKPACGEQQQHWARLVGYLQGHGETAEHWWWTPNLPSQKILPRNASWPPPAEHQPSRHTVLHQTACLSCEKVTTGNLNNQICYCYITLGQKQIKDLGFKLKERTTYWGNWIQTYTGSLYILTQACAI